MSDELRQIVLIPLLAWLALLALLLASLGYAYLPGAPVKLFAGVAVAAAMVAVIGTIYMRMRKASPLVHVAAASGLAWLSLLFIFSFADFLTR